MESIRKKQYSFPDFDSEDLAQQAYLIALKVMRKYDVKHGPIFNFLSISVNNRIKNYIRDKTTKELEAKSIESIIEDWETIGNSKTSSQEFWDMIDEYLPPTYRKDYLKMRQGIYVPKVRKHKIINEIRKIIDEEL